MCHDARIMVSSMIRPGQDGEQVPPPPAASARAIPSKIIDWCKRRWWLGLPVLVLPVVWLLGLFRRRDAMTTNGCATMTREQASAERGQINARADAALDDIHARADAGRNALDDKFGGR